MAQLMQDTKRQLLPGLKRLIEGMHHPSDESNLDFQEWGQAAESIGTLYDEWWGRVGFLMLLFGAIAWAGAGGLGWSEWRRARSWKGLARYLKTGQGLDKAMLEMDQISLIVQIAQQSSGSNVEGWWLLSSSERVIAQGIAAGKSAQEIAEELACTPSHVYNLRSSIRRKWQIESNQELQAAIIARMPEE